MCFKANAPEMKKQKQQEKTSDLCSLMQNLYHLKLVAEFAILQLLVEGNKLN